ncbi:MAG: 16S rRNA (adenine(1518)-N(6)/adenine(1519)-N(6))-dimethyltransferase RsmA [Armatimonadota bacterium]|nr:16S rRNA (adenine(1518)-N(6)/adenine(1519)-N(6))-dimethyltransferase RsmA [bacterium]
MDLNMPDINLTSAPQIKQLLAAHGLHPKKRLGQNFLIDRNVLDRIIDASGAGPGVNILEIGPGLGVVTRELAERGARVVCVEADCELEHVLRDVLAGLPNVDIVVSDVLRLKLADLLKEWGGGKWVVVGNLPYYITTPIITQMLEIREHVSAIVMMVQREVAARLQAVPHTSDYGSLSIFVQYYCRVESILKVSRNVFFPVPDVDSEVIKLVLRDTPAADVRDEELLFKIVRAAFGKRRKKLFNALSLSPELKWDKDQALNVLDKAGIDGNRRGETLSIEEFAQVANAASDVQE